jgi:hypothetical protein
MDGDESFDDELKAEQGLQDEAGHDNDNENGPGFELDTESYMTDDFDRGISLYLSALLKIN